MKKIVIIFYVIGISGTINAMHQVKSPANAQSNQHERNRHHIIPSQKNKTAHQQPILKPIAQNTQNNDIITFRQLIKENSKL